MTSSYLHIPLSCSGTSATIGGEPAATAEPCGGAAAVTPPQVIRGESYIKGYDEDTGERVIGIPHLVGRRLYIRFEAVPYPGTRPYSAITDWLNFSFPMGDRAARLAPIVERLLDLLGPSAAPVEERRGSLFRYDHAFTLGESGGVFCYGGNNGTGLISLSGEACSLIKDWDTAVRLGRDVLQARITRWDGAVDDYAGDYPVELAMQLWKEGKFGTGGNKPSMKQVGNWEEPDGRGRTLYVGNRRNGKLLRVYEKGMQLGAKWHPWTRWELSYGNRDRIVPWDVLTKPGQYVVGAFPHALSWVQKDASRVRTLQKQTQIGYETATNHLKRQYGPLIDTMLQVEGTPERVVEKLRTAAVPKRLQHPLIDKPAEWIE